MRAWSDDLRFAQQAGVAVDVRLFDGQHFFTGVADVDDEAGLASLYRPQDFNDTTTRVRIRLDEITSLTVTNVRIDVMLWLVTAGAPGPGVQPPRSPARGGAGQPRPAAVRGECRAAERPPQEAARRCSWSISAVGLPRVVIRHAP
jgi:hypothetical protein